MITGFRKLREQGKIDLEVTRENIRELAAEGKLSAELLFDAVLASGEETEAAFALIAIRTADGARLLANAVQQLIGELDTGTGASAELAEELKRLADTIAGVDAAELGADLKDIATVGGVLLLGFLARAGVAFTLYAGRAALATAANLRFAASAGTASGAVRGLGFTLRFLAGPGELLALGAYAAYEFATANERVADSLSGLPGDIDALRESLEKLNRAQLESRRLDALGQLEAADTAVAAAEARLRKLTPRPLVDIPGPLDAGQQFARRFSQSPQGEEARIRAAGELADARQTRDEIAAVLGDIDALLAGETPKKKKTETAKATSAARALERIHRRTEAALAKLTLNRFALIEHETAAHVAELETIKGEAGVDEAKRLATLEAVRKLGVEREEARVREQLEREFELRKRTAERLEAAREPVRDFHHELADEVRARNAETEQGIRLLGLEGEALIKQRARFGALAHIGAERLRLQRELSSAQRSGSDAQVAQAKAALALFESLTDKQAAYVAAMEAGAVAAERLRERTEAANQAIAQQERLAQTLESSFREFASSAISGTEDIGDAFRRMASRVIDEMLRIQLESQSLSGGGGGGGIFGDIAGTILGLFLGTAPNVNPVAKFGLPPGGSAGLLHAGGIAGALGGRRRAVSPEAFAHAPRFHRGGIAGQLRPNEVPIIAERGEEVLSESNPRHIQNLADGAGRIVINYAPVIQSDNQAAVERGLARVYPVWRAAVRRDIFTDLGRHSEGRTMAGRR